jgi:hypothetical protein
MEVHAHAHTPRKKWTHYVFEFLMLFLAVFCGFLAEYQLEHKIEKDRAKEFAFMLVDDLQKDTAAINFHIKFRETIYKNADSLMDALKFGSFETDQFKMVEYFTAINDRRVLESNRGTIDQLKHSGSLRYFKNKQFTGELIRYYNVLDIVDHWIQYLFDYESSTLGPFNREHFDSRYNDVVFRTQKKLKPFRNIGESEQITLYNISATFGQLNKILALYVLADALEKAGKLIKLIKLEYHMK